MTTPPTPPSAGDLPAEARLRSALLAAAPTDTHLDDGLADLRARLGSATTLPTPTPAAQGGRFRPQRMLAIAAALVLIGGIVIAALHQEDGRSKVITGNTPTSTTQTTRPAAQTTVASDANHLQATDLQFKAVLAVNGCKARVNWGSDPIPDPAGNLCYEVGPTAADGRDLYQAEAADQEGWVVNVRSRPGSVSDLNGLFNACYEGEPSCPPNSESGRGAVAIVLAGKVLSAPEVNGPDLADDAFTISLVDPMTEVEARALAGAIEAG